MFIVEKSLVESGDGQLTLAQLKTEFTSKYYYRPIYRDAKHKWHRHTDSLGYLPESERRRRGGACGGRIQYWLICWWYAGYHAETDKLIEFWGKKKLIAKTFLHPGPCIVVSHVLATLRPYASRSKLLLSIPIIWVVIDNTFQWSIKRLPDSINSLARVQVSPSGSNSQKLLCWAYHLGIW